MNGEDAAALVADTRQAHDRLVDIRGQCCAQPVIRLAQEMRSLQAGDVILAVADKASMRKDIPAFCNQTGNALIHAEERDLLLYFWMRKG